MTPHLYRVAGRRQDTADTVTLVLAAAGRRVGTSRGAGQDGRRRRATGGLVGRHRPAGRARPPRHARLESVRAHWHHPCRLRRHVVRRPGPCGRDRRDRGPGHRRGGQRRTVHCGPWSLAAGCWPRRAGIGRGRRGARRGRCSIRPVNRVRQGAAATHGPALFARHAYPPNALGYCGPADSQGLLERAGGDGPDPAGVAALARQLAGAWPYLCLIARANGLRDPLARQ